MPYDDDFYDQYREYLEEPVVRKQHGSMFNLFGSICCSHNYGNVIDLGSGLNEYLQYSCVVDNYLAIDYNNPNNIKNFIEGDYTIGVLKYLKDWPFQPNIFVSLFSIEACLPPDAKYHLYRRIFEEVPSIRYGLVSGFYYESKRDNLLVNENGKITSFQTIENQMDWQDDTFTEMRTILRVPSKMFGDDVYEVWKILKRN